MMPGWSAAPTALLQLGPGPLGRQPVDGGYRPDIGPLAAVTARAANDVWAGSGSGLLHWDGSAWTASTVAFPLLQLADLELVGTTEIWVGGRDSSAIK